MLLCELTDQQVAGAFIDQDPMKRRINNAMNPRQLATQNGQQQALDRQSKDPLTLRIASLRAQLAQLIVQQQKQRQDADRRAGGQGSSTVASVPGSTNPRQ